MRDQAAATVSNGRRFLYPAVALLLIALSTARIVSTYNVLSATVDEPIHIAAGMQWLERKLYVYDHPPLARVAAALPLYLAGFRSTLEIPAPLDWTSITEKGKEILYSGGSYSRNLTLSRLGTLPFFLVTCLVVWFWTSRIFSGLAALMAILLFTTVPPVLGHSGLATTDMAVTATITAALYSFYLWLEQPTMSRCFLLGLFLGLSALAKFSSLMFFPVCFLAVLGLYWFTGGLNLERLRDNKPRLLKSFGLCCGVIFIIVWSGYQFSSVPLTTSDARPHPAIDRYSTNRGMMRDFAYFLVETPIPAGDLIRGIRYQWDHNSGGQYSYLLGDVRKDGWWYFFPVALSVKTPIPFLLLYGLGLFLLTRQTDTSAGRSRWVPALLPLVILFVCLTSKLNLGVRYILPIYPMLAMIAGFGVARLIELSPRSKTVLCAAVLLLLWQLKSSALAHPDYLAYFNELGGQKPERILVDSDLDWGQDLNRLRDKLRELKVNSLAISYFGTADLTRHGLPSWKPLFPNVPTTGWIAISLYRLKMPATALESEPVFNAFSWLERWQPVTMIGKSIRLYYVPPSTNMGQEMANNWSD